METTSSNKSQQANISIELLTCRNFGHGALQDAHQTYFGNT